MAQRDQYGFFRDIHLEDTDADGIQDAMRVVLKAVEGDVSSESLALYQLMVTQLTLQSQHQRVILEQNAEIIKYLKKIYSPE